MRASQSWIGGVALLIACGGGEKDSVPLAGDGSGGDSADAGSTDLEDSDEPEIPDGTLEEVLPIIEANCVACHNGGASPAADLDLETDFCSAVLDGRLIVPGSTGESLLYRRVTSDDAPMPPSGRLDDDIIRPMGVWILNGAPCE